jgi:hypothetical protein
MVLREREAREQIGTKLKDSVTFKDLLLGSKQSLMERQLSNRTEA